MPKPAYYQQNEYKRAYPVLLETNRPNVMGFHNNEQSLILNAITRKMNYMIYEMTHLRYIRLLKIPNMQKLKQN